MPMDFRGGGGGDSPPWQVAPQAAPQDAAQQLPPSLLQMAQGMAPQMAGGGGPSAFSGDNVPFGAEVRPITSPEDQNWSDALGNPIHVGGAPPAYSERGNEGVFPSIFSQGAPQSGWFNLNDYYKGAPARADNPEAQSVPRQFSSGSERLSTNNWNLLPPDYRDPNYFQINGRIIDRRKVGTELSPAGEGSYMGAESGPVATTVNRGSSGAESGFPRVFWSGWDAKGAFPGQLGGRPNWATPNY